MFVSRAHRPDRRLELIMRLQPTERKGCTGLFWEKHRNTWIAQAAAGARQEREQKVVKPYGESNQHVQADEHRRTSKILKNG